MERAFQGYIARNPHVAPPKEGAISAALGACAFVFLAGFIALSSIGVSVLASFLVLLGLVSASAVAGLGVLLVVSKSQARRHARDMDAEREARAQDTEKQIHRARVLGKFDNFGPRQ